VVKFAREDSGRASEEKRVEEVVAQIVSNPRIRIIR